jgi:hypothetical protein
MLASFTVSNKGVIISIHKNNDLGTEYIITDTVKAIWQTYSEYWVTKKFTNSYDKKIYHIEVLDTL